MKTALAALSLLAPAATASAPVAFEGDRVAFASWFEARDSNRVRVWNLTTAA